MLGKLTTVSLQVQAVRLIAEGTAPRRPQPEEGATYEGIQKKETARVSTKPSYPTLSLSVWSGSVKQGLADIIETAVEGGVSARHLMEG